MKDNILHIFASSTWGGGEQYIYDLAKKQLESGYGICLASASSKYIRQKVKDLKCSYYILKNRWHFNLFSILHVRRIILSEKISIVHVHQFKDAFIAVFASCLLSAVKRPTIIMTRHLVKEGKTNRLYCWLYKRLDKIIFVSELAKTKFLNKVSLQLHINNVAVVHNSLPERKSIVTTNFRKQLNIANDYVLLGFLGRIAKIKGVELLLEVAEKVKDKKVVFLLAGDGEEKYEMYLKSIIAEKQLTSQVHLIGYLENPESFVAEMDIGILPSLVVESFGLSVLEFMQAGVPVITSNTGAQVEFVENERTGILVDPTETNITKALLELLNDEAKRRKIGENAKLFCKEKFNYDTFYNNIMKEYQLEV